MPVTKQNELKEELEKLRTQRAKIKSERSMCGLHSSHLDELVSRARVKRLEKEAAETEKRILQLRNGRSGDQHRQTRDIPNYRFF